MRSRGTSRKFEAPKFVVGSLQRRLEINLMYVTTSARLSVIVAPRYRV